MKQHRAGHGNAWLLLILGAIGAAVFLVGQLGTSETITAAPLPQATGTPLINDAPGIINLGAEVVVGVRATPGAANTPAVYEPVRTDGSGRLQTAPGGANAGYAPGTVVPIQPNGAPAAQTPIAVATPVVQVNGTVVVAQTTPLPLSGAAVAVVQLTALPAGENFIGKVGGSTLHPSSNPTLSVAASYVSGDYVGTSSTPWSFTACRTSGGAFQVQSMTVVDKAIQSVAGELWLFDRSVTVPLDSAAWTVTDADAQFLIGVIPTGPYYASAANSVSVTTGVGMTGWCNSGTTVSAAFVTRGAPSYASGDLTVILGVVTD